MAIDESGPVAFPNPRDLTGSEEKAKLLGRQIAAYWLNLGRIFIFRTVPAKAKNGKPMDKVWSITSNTINGFPPKAS